MTQQLIIIILMATLFGCNNNSQQTLRLGHVSWPGYEALSLAKEKDLYTNINVKIIRPSNNAENMLAFEHNIIDIAAVTLNNAVELQNNLKEPILVFAVLDVSLGGDVIIAQQEIKSVADLKGKRLGMVPSSFGAYFVARAIDSVPGLQFKQLQIIPITIDHHFDHFMINAIDAIATYEPVKSKILHEKGHVIFDSTQIPNEIFDVLITKASFAKKNSGALSELLNGYFKALDLIKKQPDRAIDSMAAFEGVSTDEYKKSLAGIHIPDRAENKILLGTNDSTILITAKRLQSFLKEQNIIKQDSQSLPKISNRYLFKTVRKQQ